MRINSSSATCGINSRPGFKDTKTFPVSMGYTVTCLSRLALFSRVFGGAGNRTLSSTLPPFLFPGGINTNV